MGSMVTSFGPGTGTTKTQGQAVSQPFFNTTDLIRFAYDMTRARRGAGGGGGAGSMSPPVRVNPNVLGDAGTGTLEGQAKDAALRRSIIENENPNGPTPADFGRYQADKYGNWGTFVDTANIPVGLQDKIMGGFHGDIGNWDSSNPQITGPQQLATGKYKHLSGAGPRAEIGPGGETTPGEQPPETFASRYFRDFGAAPGTRAIDIAARQAGMG